MSRPDDETSEAAFACGVVFLLVGSLLVVGLMVHGVGVALSTDPGPSMGPVNHIIGSLTIGPFAVLLIAGGFRMVHRRRWD